MTFALRTACAPYALTFAFQESYDQCCQRLHAAGGHYSKPNNEAFHNTIKTKLGKEPKVVEFKEPVDLRQWAKKQKGTWIAVAGGMRGGHAVTVKNGKILDNGYVQWASFDNFYVEAAWQMKAA